MRSTAARSRCGRATRSSGGASESNETPATTASASRSRDHWRRRAQPNSDVSSATSSSRSAWGNSARINAIGRCGGASVGGRAVMSSLHCRNVCHNARRDGAFGVGPPNRAKGCVGRVIGAERGRSDRYFQGFDSAGLRRNAVSVRLSRKAMRSGLSDAVIANPCTLGDLLRLS